MNELTAPITVVAETIQAQDVAMSKGPTDIIKRRGRVKQYIKDDDMDRSLPPSLLPFPQPYQWASQITGRRWSDCNKVFTEQVQGCNLSCPYCYVDTTSQAKPDMLSPEEIVSDFEAQVPEVCVFRISGGEPFLYYHWLAQVEMAFYKSFNLNRSCLWIDTNLTIIPPTVAHTTFNLAAERVAVCGCFKPGQAELALQLQTVRYLVGAGVNLFLYWPCDSYRVELLFDILDSIEKISHFLPLRLTPIEIRWDYETVNARQVADVPTGAESHATWQQMMEAWREWCCEHYQHSELWEPSHLLPIKADGR